MDIIDCDSSQSDGQRPLTAPAFKVFTDVTTITDSQDFQLASLTRGGGIQDHDDDVGLLNVAGVAAPHIDI